MMAFLPPRAQVPMLSHLDSTLLVKIPSEITDYNSILLKFKSSAFLNAHSSSIAHELQLLFSPYKPQKGSFKNRKCINK